jgi:hypothetical protein
VAVLQANSCSHTVTLWSGEGLCIPQVFAADKCCSPRVVGVLLPASLPGQLQLLGLAPILFVGVQVCTYDLWDRMTTEGYGWLQLGPADSSGSCTHYVDTWKPLGKLTGLGAATTGVCLCIGCALGLCIGCALHV